jgi:hypothetical protein
LLGSLIDCTQVDDFMKYQLIEILHSKLWEDNLRIKEVSMKALFLLCRKSEFDFMLIFENLIERCNESKNEDLVVIFLKNLETLQLTFFAEKLSTLVVDMIKNPLFSSSRDCRVHLLTFMQNIMLSIPQLNNELTKQIFMYVCRNLRNFHTEIRKKCLDVFCCLNFKCIDDDKLIMVLQKEKFEDYQPQKKGQQNNNKYNNFNNNNNNNANNNNNNNNKNQNNKHKGIENKTEKTIELKELKSINDNILIGSILHVLEDEMPEIRIASIKALLVLGKLNAVGKIVDVKELLLYFLNDDFDQVRIKS